MVRGEKSLGRLEWIYSKIGYVVHERRGREGGKEKWGMPGKYIML